MEISLIKYLAFMLGSVLIAWITMLWLKSNRLKRKHKFKEEERLEIEKQLNKQAREEKEKITEN